MTAPRTRIAEGATEFERDLLRSWEHEQPSDAARQAALGLVGVAAGLGASTTASTAAAAGLKAATGTMAPKAATLGVAALGKWALVGAGVVVLAVAGATVEHARSSSKAVPAEQVAAMLASCDRCTALGRRDLAVLTVLSRLGLRASEVAGLQLEDIDWHRGEITVTGKCSRTERLPLPADVGAAVVAYLRDGRPRSGDREVFLCDRAPHRGMSRGAVTNVAARAARKAGLGTVHAHRLRHSAATAMLDAGGSLDEIGQVLRHRHALTTAIYAKADITALRAVARPWRLPSTQSSARMLSTVSDDPMLPVASTGASPSNAIVSMIWCGTRSPGFILASVFC